MQYNSSLLILVLFFLKNLIHNILKKLSQGGDVDENIEKRPHLSFSIFIHIFHVLPLLLFNKMRTSDLFSERISP